MLKIIWKSLTLFLFIGVLFVLFIPAALLIWGVQEQPLVLVGQRMNYEHVTRLHRLMKAHDPRRMRAGEIKRLVTVEDDLNLALQYVSSNLKDAGARVEIENNKATLRFSAGLRALKMPGYINASMSLVQSGRNFRLESVRLGQIAVPDWVSRNLSLVAHHLMLNLEQYRDSISAINKLSFQPRAVELVYQWRPELIKEIVIAHRTLFSSPQDDERFAVYEQRIAEVSRELHIIAPVKAMLSSLFETAYQRSTDSQQAVAENSALLSALGVYMAGDTAQKLLGRTDQTRGERAVRRYLTLAGRYDLAQHFILSAYLANSAGEGVADGLGLLKEFKDSQGGSGFSFADLAADLAGRKFAELATNPDTARQLQEVVKSARSENVFMPNIDNLPEGIQELEFKARYTSLGSDEYNLLYNEIEKRLQTCRAYRG